MSIEIFEYEPMIYNVAQRSKEWYELRMGCVTASQVMRIMGGRGGDITYMNELIAQKLTYQYKEIYLTDAIDHGVQHEGDAILAYEFHSNNSVSAVGFVKCNDLLGVSPDGFVGDSGLVEVKCPDSNTHIGYIREDDIPKKYLYQMLYQMIVTNRHWCDFVSYDPRMPYPHNLFVKRCCLKDYSDECDKLKDRLVDFLGTYKEALCLFE